MLPGYESIGDHDESSAAYEASGNNASSSPEMLVELNERLETAREYDIKWVGEIPQIDHRFTKTDETKQ